MTAERFPGYVGTNGKGPVEVLIYSPPFLITSMSQLFNILLSYYSYLLNRYHGTREFLKSRTAAS